jgi:hypothetical protein
MLSKSNIYLRSWQRSMKAKNIMIVLEGKTTYRFHRKTPKKKNENSYWTAGATTSLVICQILPKTGFLGMIL